MRVTSGLAKGKRLITLEGEEIRPTTDRVKEALFSSIQFEIEGSTVLDLFAGCGQLGIEAISRGAKKAVFCDKSDKARGVIKTNLENCGFKAESFSILPTDAITFLNTTDIKFDFCFIDPPYREDYYEKTLAAVGRVINRGGIIICEHPVDIKLNDTYGDFKKVKDYRFSKIMLSKYKKEV